MTRTALLTITATTALALCAGSPKATAAEEVPVLAQNINKPRASGKVAAVLWTVRNESCTLQVVLPIPGTRMATRTARSDGSSVQPPRIQVWLLKADGAHIPWTRVWHSPGFDNARNRGMRAPGPEVNYSFPLSSASEAVAVAISIDNDFYIEPLEQLGKTKI